MLNRFNPFQYGLADTRPDYLEEFSGGDRGVVAPFSWSWADPLGGLRLSSKHEYNPILLDVKDLPANIVVNVINTIAFYSSGEELKRYLVSSLIGLIWGVNPGK